jgi:hypothetical protein
MKDIALNIVSLIREEFDKIMLLVLFGVMAHLHLDTEVVMGALMALVTGRVIAQKVADKQ